MKILISGIGGPTPLGIAKSLRLKYKKEELTLIGIDGSKFAPGLYNKQLFDKTFLVPHAHDESYWNVIDKIVKEEKIDHAFIIPETEVLVWAKRQKESGLPCTALIPEQEIAEVFYDKYKTFELLEGSGLVPFSIKLDQSTNTENIGITLGYPYWIRAGSGAGAIGAYKIESAADLKNWININPGINDFLASVYLPGRNYACKLLFKNGKLIRSASGERVEYLMSKAAPSGISGMCARGNLINNDELVKNAATAIISIFNSFNKVPHGMFTADFKEDKDSIPKITEINIRHVSFTHAFSMAGANFAVDTVEMFNNPDYDHTYNMYGFEEGLTFIRGVDSEIFLIKDSALLDLYIC